MTQNEQDELKEWAEWKIEFCPLTNRYNQIPDLLAENQRMRELLISVSRSFPTNNGTLSVMREIDDFLGKS